jgi:hypothetical protein
LVTPVRPSLSVQLNWKMCVGLEQLFCHRAHKPGLLLVCTDAVAVLWEWWCEIGLGYWKGQRFSSSLHLQDRLWDPSSLLGNGYLLGTGGKAARA